jgi:hypothetical protein
MTRASLHLVPDQPEPDIAKDIQRLLIQRQHAVQALAWADEELLPLRRQYARDRGEYLLPSIERLNREFGSNGE